MVPSCPPSQCVLIFSFRAYKTAINSQFGHLSTDYLLSTTRTHHSLWTMEANQKGNKWMQFIAVFCQSKFCQFIHQSEQHRKSKRIFIFPAWRYDWSDVAFAKHLHETFIRPAIQLHCLVGCMILQFRWTSTKGWRICRKDWPGTNNCSSFANAFEKAPLNIRYQRKSKRNRNNPRFFVRNPKIVFRINFINWSYI